ncbi:MAG: hypothetical protein ACI4J7_03980, partial [Ruminiclostridium sp.]
GAVLSNSNIIGYNILAKNVQIIRSRDKYATNRAGDIIGYIDAGCSFKLVGLSAPKNKGVTNYMKKDAGTNNGELYLIYADYEGACLGDDCNKTSSPINNTSNVADASPYVNVNPAVSIDGTNTLTGDGVSSTALNNILKDIADGSAKAYQNVNADAEIFIDSNFSDKLSTFNTKTGAEIANDFPVIVLNDSGTNITSLLNSCIHLLTNNSKITSYTKSETDSNGNKLFNVDIACYSYNNDSNVFEREAGAASIVINNGYFTMTDDYDSAYNNRFTLIDVQYYAPDNPNDPNEKNRVAYHLYIPVYVEKMLKFDFTIGALSGTRYNSDLYLSVLGDPVLENYGTPVTAYVTYSYLRTAAEWQDAINGGENLLKSYGKSVVMNEQVFPSGTKIALVDRNRDGKAYYSDMDTAFDAVDKKLNFSSFKASDDTGFSPVSFLELLEKSADISVGDPVENGTLAKCGEDEVSEATVKIGGIYYRRKKDTDTEAYSVTVTPKEGMVVENDILTVEESYYLSFFTESHDSFGMLNVLITCASRLGDSGMTPSRMNNTAIEDKTNSVRVILGNLYEQDVTFTTTGSEVINDDNRTITGELKTVISIKQSPDLVKSFLGSPSIHIYHGFIIEASRKEEGAVEKGVKGSPRVYGTYTIGENSYPFDFSNPDSVITIIGKDSNGDALDIKDYLKNSSNSSVTITCSDLKISYDDDTSIIDQFPERKNSNSDNGVTYSALSNLAYVEDNVGQSTISKEAPDGKSYYRDNISTVSLNYDIPALMPNELTNCGVNGLEKNGEITAVGYYNVVNVPQSDLDRAKKVKLTLSLYQKDDDKQYNQVDISSYLTGAAINGVTAAKAEQGDVFYTVIADISELTSEANSFEIPTSYSVITGDEFEKNTKVYANYKVVLEAQLLDESGSSIDNTICSDYIIYTNAKIFTEMISVG